MEPFRLDPMIALFSDLRPISVPFVITKTVLEERKLLIGLSEPIQTESSARSACSRAFLHIVVAAHNVELPLTVFFLPMDFLGQNTPFWSILSLKEKKEKDVQ